MAVGQVYQHQATGEWLRAGGVLLGGTPPPGGNQPTGPGIQTYQSKYVSGDRITTTMSRMSTQAMMSYPADVFEDPDFSEGSGKFMSYIPDICSGMLGSGKDYTVFQLVAGSSTKKSSVPTTGTNPLYLFRTQTNPSGGFKTAGFTVNGTEQPVDPNTGRPHAYGAFMLDHVNAPDNSDVRFVGVPGEGNSPPGETFCGYNDFGCTNGHYTRIETDGRIGSNTPWYTPTFFSAGTKVSASPWGANSSSGPVLTDCYFHHCRASMPTFWQTVGATTYNLRAEHNGSGAAPLSGHGINHERPSGTYHHYNPIIIIDRASGNTGLHMSLLGDQANTNEIHLHGMVPGINFDQTSGTPFRSCFSVQMHAAGATYQGNPTTQTFPPHLYKPDGTAFTVDTGSVPSGANPASEFGVFL